MLLRRLDCFSRGSCFTSSWWKAFWDLPLLPKLQLFCWKLLHNPLPLNGVLQQRGIPVETTCVLCLGYHESVDHLFRDCSFVSDIWMSVPLFSSLVVRWDVHFSVWFVELIFQLRQNKLWDTLISVVSFFWAIWIARNHKVFRHAVISPTVILHIMQDWVSRSSAAEDFRASLTGVASGSIRQPVLSSCYLMGTSDSSADVYLLIDGAYNSHDNTAGAGWIFRPPHSDIVRGGGSRAFLSSSAFQSELQACLWALQAVDRRGFQRLLIYTDYSILLPFLGNDGCRDISCLWLLQDIRNLVCRFSSCVIQKVPRHWLCRRIKSKIGLAEGANSFVEVALVHYHFTLGFVVWVFDLGGLLIMLLGYE
ncbi:uncharacterized protein LOC110720069 [Chenopodium quinoa]|uniref:uncharacterized protein LOC110720069 n=1 Tax=Chenopodium quinoa TaxID=63459 RepID=UPI000B7994A7|nr:uncharacterized protein LOC110720069 [Chenopodium quinoa]